MERFSEPRCPTTTRVPLGEIASESTRSFEVAKERSSCPVARSKSRVLPEASPQMAHFPSGVSATQPLPADTLQSWRPSLSSSLARPSMRGA